ncbi:hypothetical protein F2Q70_00038783 [Brassica cretica]|uniref:Uncharacterized protein n=1 Tax=Brassica cretica TaxID=69181 RepID=A0A8S9K3V6_BRACR|nr:hypothetical protein F2Q70_00038783 [Brassica cretica]
MTPPVLDVKVIVAGDDDWLPQPPKVVSDKSKESGEDSTIKALRKQRQVKLTECRTAVGAFGGGEYTNGVYATALMVVKAGSSDRPAIPGLNSPPFLPAEIFRETMGDHPCVMRRSLTKYKSLFPAIDFSTIVGDNDILWKPSPRETSDEVAARGESRSEEIWPNEVWLADIWSDPSCTGSIVVRRVLKWWWRDVKWWWRDVRRFSGMGIKNESMPFRVMSGWEVCGHSKCRRVLCGQTMRCGHTSCEVVVERRKGRSGVGNQEWVYLNALGLFLRLDVRDVLDCFKDRLELLAARLTDQANWYLDWQLDILIVWALAKVGETSMAHELLEGLKFRLMNKKKQQVMQKGIQLGEAVCEYAKGNYKQALCLLGSDFNAIDYKIDVFNEVWCQLLLKTGQSSTAKEVIRKRIKVREGSPFTWRLLEKSYAMEGDAEARNAGQRAKMLESSYF